MKKMAMAAALFATVSVIGANDVLQTMKIKSGDATQEVVQSLVSGNVNVWRVRETFRSAPPAVRASLVEQALVWTKAYVHSAQFAKDYAAYREQAKPQADVPALTVDQELAERKKKRDADLEEGKKNIANMPAEYRKAAEEGYKAAAAALEQMDTPEFRKMERDGIELQRKQDADAHAARVARWQKEYPADPRQLVRQRLEQFLRETADVDYAAKLNGKKFANAAYERKPDEWKLAYRAGKEPAEKARAFAQAWLQELK